MYKRQFNALCAFVGGFSMEKYVSFMTCADFIVSTPDYFRYNPADEFITPEQIEEIAANTKSSLSGTGYAVRKPVYLWMTEDALRQDYARYESAEQLDLSLIHIYTKRPCLILQKKQTATKQTAPQRVCLLYTS